MTVYRSLFAAAMVAAAFGTSADAAIVFSTSQTAPTVDGADIANLGPYTISDFGTSVIWGDRQARGQSFVTGSAATYELNALTFQSTGNQNANSDYTVRVGTLVGTAITDIYEENTGSVTTDVAANDYVTWSFSTPIVLTGNTTYAIDVLRSNGSGYIFGGKANSTYADGAAFTSGNGTSANDNGPVATFHDQDRVFHLDLVAIPEPASLTLVGLGGAMLLGRRRR